MDQQKIISEVEARARSLNLAMGEICRRADVHPTTFSRWKLSDKNPEPIGATLATLSKLQTVLDLEEARMRGVITITEARAAA